MQFIAYGLAIVLVVLVFSRWKRASGIVLGVLAFMWAWIGVAYMWMHFAEINRAAYLFGAIFVAEAVLLGVAAFRNRGVTYGREPDRRTYLGVTLIVYAMVIYPLIGMALGHGYPQAPMFGVAPCPTTIFTFGILLLAARPQRLLVWLALLWSMIGFVAALKLGIREDIGLLLAGVVTAVVVLRVRPARDGARAIETSPQRAS